MGLKMRLRNPVIHLKLAVQLVQSRLAGWLVGKRVQALLVQSEHGVFAIDPLDRGVGRRLLVDGSYNEAEVNRLCDYLSPDAEVLIVGAHIGAIAIPLSRRCKNIVAVEPNPASYNLLKTNLLLNGIDNCQLLNVAASDKPGTIEMLISTANSGGSKRVPLRSNSIYEYDNPRRITVEALPLDGTLGARTFALVVMDIEGSEYFALNGMQSILQRSSALAVEFLPHHLRDVAGISVVQFLEPIAPYFTTLSIPTKKLTIGRDQFQSTLTAMYERDEGDDGIIFAKA